MNLAETLLVEVQQEVAKKMAAGEFPYPSFIAKRIMEREKEALNAQPEQKDLFWYLVGVFNDGMVAGILTWHQVPVARPDPAP